MKAPVLSFADYSKPFLLETNASKDGLGAVLLQKGNDGKYHPIAYRSKALSKSEKNYHSSKLEFLFRYISFTLIISIETCKEV